MVQRNFSIALVTLLLSSCGPIYQTNYRFIPPESSGGRACTYQCETSLSQCRQIEELRANECNRQSRYEADQCEYDISIRKGRDPKWYECGVESCTPDFDQCDEQYRHCFQVCGGSVEAQSVCVANCEQIPPPPPKR